MTRRLSPLLAVLALLACGGGDRPAADASADSTASPAPPSASADSAAPAVAAAEAGGPTIPFRVRPGLDLRLALVPGAGGAIREVRVLPAGGGAPIQTLGVEDDETEGAEPPGGRISDADLDGDGHADLGVVVSFGMANSWLRYWRWDPAAGRFVALGRYPWLTRDAARNTVTTHERGGSAGLLWTAESYRWRDGRLELARREEQAFGDGARGYVRTAWEPRGGRLQVVAADTFPEGKAGAEASWENQ